MSLSEKQTIDTLDGAAVYGNVAVTASATELRIGAAALVGRSYLSIQPVDGPVWIGYSSGITTSNGTKLFLGQLILIPIGDTFGAWAITASGTVNVRIAELSS